MKIALYARVSTTEQTTDNQVFELRRYCEARGWTIAQEFKARVKGRQQQHDVVVDVRDFAEAIGLPIGWVVNALRAHLLRELFPNDMMNAELDRHGPLVRIPPTFGMDWLDG